MLSFTEENYLKCIYHLSENGQKEVNTNSISESLHTSPASVSDMLQKLSKKKVLNYARYKGVSLTDKGAKLALQIVRNHRLWEVFLVEKLNFQWDEVHEIAEQLEHIRSSVLISRLDEFLGFPAYDPHGDPIPDEAGEMKAKLKTLLSDVSTGTQAIVVGLKETSSLFLQHLDKTGIYIGARLKLVDRIAFDASAELMIDGKKRVIVSDAVAKNIYLGIAESRPRGK